MSKKTKHRTIENIHYSVLIVDDEKINLELLGNILENEDFKVERACCGKDALQFFEKNSVDLILLDIIMPDIDGFKVCKQLKENPQTENIPVIFVTSKTDIDTQTKGFAAGCVDFIPKTPSPAIIAARIKTHIELKMHRDQLEQLVQERTAQLQKAYDQINTLKGLLPICANCKKIRDDRGAWNNIESYIQKRSQIEFTHGICPQCAHTLNPELYEE